MWITSSLSTTQTPTDIALGNFDGVHLGHQVVIRNIIPTDFPSSAPTNQRLSDLSDLSTLKGYSDRSASLLQVASPDSTEAATPTPPGMPIPTVVTFYPHPREFFSGQSRPWLTPLDEKASFMKQIGVRQLVLLPFNQELASLPAEDFVQAVLIDRLQAQHISVGADFRFGHNRTGDVHLLAQLATRQGVKVTVVELAQDGRDRISSSRIRQALCAGNTDQVQALMGRPYRLIGRVVQGEQLGRQLGFPTANLKVPPEKFLPRTGVYSVLVYGIPGNAADAGLPGVMNLGVRPTVDGQAQTIEVHVLNWQGNLYGRTLTVAVKGFLRAEQRFDSLDHLKAQIQADCEAALAVL